MSEDDKKIFDKCKTEVFVKEENEIYIIKLKKSAAGKSNPM